MRKVSIMRNYLQYPEGSALIQMGNTKVICTASVEKIIPSFLEDTGEGWITAEYGMLPRSTNIRSRREASAGKIRGRTAEIQRLIGRALRSVTDRSLFPDHTITIDCDVIQADGGTRTAAITGSCVALFDCFNWMSKQNILVNNPLREWIAAISVGIIEGEPRLDLNYELDSAADTDMNVVMTESGKFIEIQGTAEKIPFSAEELQTMLSLAGKGITKLINIQKEAVGMI